MKKNKYLKLTDNFPFGRYKFSTLKFVMEENPSYIVWFHSIKPELISPEILIKCQWVVDYQNDNEPDELDMWASEIAWE